MYLQRDNNRKPREKNFTMMWNLLNKQLKLVKLLGERERERQIEWVEQEKEGKKVSHNAKDNW